MNIRWWWWTNEYVDSSSFDLIFFACNKAEYTQRFQLLDELTLKNNNRTNTKKTCAKELWELYESLIL